MKKILKWGGIAFLVLVVLAAIGGAGKSPTQKNTTSQSGPTSKMEQQQEPTDVPYEDVDAKTFIDAFDKNQLKAEKEYKDKKIKTTAFIQNISEDIVGSPFLSLKPSEDKMYFGTTIKCDFKNKDDLTTVENGQSVTVAGTVTSQTLGIIGLKDCHIVK